MTYNMASGDKQENKNNYSKERVRSFDLICGDIFQSFETITSLLSKKDTPNKNKMADTRAFLQNRFKKISDQIQSTKSLKKTLLLLKEKKKISQELLTEIDKNQEPLDKEKTNIILSFIGKSASDNDSIETKDKDFLPSMLQDFIKDIDDAIQKVSKDFLSSEKELSKGKKTYFTKLQFFLKKDLKEKGATAEKNKNEKLIFDNEIEKLDKLERELKLYFINEKTKDQMNDLRDFLKS